MNKHVELSTYTNIRLELPMEHVCTLTINRPKQLNALSQQTLVEIEQALQVIAESKEIRVLLVTGEGQKAFIAGADISEFSTMTPVDARKLAQNGQKVFNLFERLPIPVIAVVNGYCLGGGCELAMSCDWIIASENARFGQPEINLGLVPGFGGSQRLSRLAGKARAMELIMTGRQIGVDEAKSIGIVNHVYPASELMDEALKTARLLTKKAPVAMELAKEAVLVGQDQNLEDACKLESELFGVCFSTEDKSEGIAAFLGKREAEFKGR